MTRARLLIAALGAAAAPGCFYVDGINQRPSIAIVRVTETSLTRASALELRAQVHDSSDDSVALTWRAYRCGATLSDCEDEPFDDGAGTTFRTMIPVRTSAQALVQHVRVTLAARDSHGAVADPPQSLDLDVFNAPPVLDAPVVFGTKVVGAALEWRVRFKDPDGASENVVLTWQVNGPTAATLRRLGSAADVDGYRVDRAELSAAGVGAWKATVIATDEVGAAAVVSSDAVDVREDQPPCLTTLAPGTGAPLLLDQPRRFSVLRVVDDLDPYPLRAGSPGPRFTWSLLAPSRGATRVVQAGVTGNAIELDPAGFVPGEVLQLRVEIADRMTRALPPGCTDSSDSCSLQQNACTQRQTWRLEVR